jgi:hypothetical protein
LFDLRADCGEGNNDQIDGIVPFVLIQAQAREDAFKRMLCQLLVD